MGFGDLLPVGGKANVLALREEAGSFTCPRVAFLVDRDLWTLSGTPDVYVVDNLIITDGYSIENDLLRDCNAENLLDDGQLEDYHEDLKLIISWYASGVTARLQGVGFDFDRSLDKILSRAEHALTPEASIDLAMFEPDPALVEQISSDHQRFLRGKTWLKLLARYLTARGRIQHSTTALLDMGLKSGGTYSSALIDKLRDQLAD